LEGGGDKWIRWSTPPRPPPQLAVQTLQSKRWRRFGGVFIIAGICTAFWGTLPAGIAVYQLDNVAADANGHWNSGQTTLVWISFGLMGGGIAATFYIAYRLFSRPCLRRSTFGVTIYNWRSTVDVPWAEVGRVVLVSATRMRRAGWVPAIMGVQRDAVPIRFGPFLRADAGRSAAVAPPIPTDGAWALIAAAVQQERTPQNAAGPVTPGSQVWVAVGTAPSAPAQANPLALPEGSEIGWGNGKVVVAEDWVAYREKKGKVPWNVWAYGELADAHGEPNGDITVERSDGTRLVITKAARQSLEGVEMLAHGLANVATADLKSALAEDATKARSVREAHLARWHRVDDTGTVHVFTFRGSVHTWMAGIFILGGVCAFGGAVAYPFYGKPPAPGFELLFIALGLCALWFGICMLKQGVTIGPDRMLVWNELSFLRVDPRQVRALTLVRRSKGDAGVLWEAQVDRFEGRPVRIRAMNYGPASVPPSPARLQLLNEMRQVLGVAGRQEGY
jgi:hypothetical protein